MACASRDATDASVQPAIDASPLRSAAAFVDWLSPQQHDYPIAVKRARLAILGLRMQASNTLNACAMPICFPVPIKRSRPRIRLLDSD
jgi:hypothetical protein